MRKWFSKFPIWYLLGFGILWFFWQLFTDELASLIRGHISEGGVIMYGVTHPSIIMPSLIILFCVYVLIQSKKKTRKEKNEELKEWIPQLELSTPTLVPNKFETVLHDNEPWFVNLDLWRVSLTNVRPHSQASNVSVKVIKSDPPINMLPVFLHEKGDDSNYPHKRSFTLRYNESVEFDVIGCQTLNRDGINAKPISLLYLYRTDSSIIPCRIPPKEVLQAMNKDGILLTIAVFADMPCDGIEKQYRAFFDPEGHFKLDTMT